MIDLSILRNLMGNDEKMVQQFLHIFKTQTPEQLNQLDNFISNKDWESASAIAHAIKSQSKYLGLEEIANQAFTIEKNTEKKENLPDIQNKFNVLKKLTNTILADPVFI